MDSSASSRKPSTERNSGCSDLMGGFQRGDTLSHVCCDLRHRFVVGVLGARPEESAQPVLAAARYDVYVKMRDALADPVIHRHQGALSSLNLLHRPAEEPRGGEEG